MKNISDINNFFEINIDENIGNTLFETLNQYMRVRKLELPDSVKDFSDYFNFTQKSL